MTEPHTARLIALARSTPWFMRALRAAQQLGLHSWCIGAGAVRTLVWDALHGFPSPSHLPDLDLVYFDAADARPDHEEQLQETLQLRAPEFPWEVVNQAAVHHWLGAAQGESVAAFTSLEEGVASWPEFATCVGLYLQRDGQIASIAPHGLDDLFALTLRHNPRRVSAAVFQARLAKKRFQQHWPQVRVITPCAADQAQRITAPLAPPSASPR